MWAYLRKMPLWQQVFIGLVLGILAGLVFGDAMTRFKWIGDTFIRLIMMGIAPLVFFSIVSGIISLGDPKTLGRVGLKAFGLFIFITVAAIIIALVVGNVVRPGSGLPESFAAQIHEAQATSAAQGITVQERPKLSDILLSIVPRNIFKAFADQELLQIIFFAIFLGVVLVMLRERTKAIHKLVDQGAIVFIKVIEIVINLAPLAVFALTAWVVGEMGINAVSALGLLVVAVVSACIIHYLLLLGLLRVSGVNPLPFVKKALEFQLLAFSTSSSSATMPTTMRVTEHKLGVSNSTTSLVVPLGATINMQGTAIYVAMCTLFIAQLLGVSFSLEDYITIITTIVLIAVGTAAIPSGSLILIPIVLNAVGLPPEAVVVIIAVDRVLDMVRTTINVTGDSITAVIVDKSEHQLNKQQYVTPAAKVPLLEK